MFCCAELTLLNYLGQKTIFFKLKSQKCQDLYFNFFTIAEFPHPDGKNLLCDSEGVKCWDESFSNSTKHANCQNCYSDCDQVIYDYFLITEKSSSKECVSKDSNNRFMREYFMEYETESKMEEFISKNNIKH